ncbi:MAG: glycosyltransferase, partial [Deltaproteobacteria bacterium]|nr:glycosyltransferase [Deltaproteobacteria bacterium]
LALSPSAETFSYTLSESWAAGVPAIVRDLGAPADRVRRSGAGIVVRDAHEAASALRRLALRADERRQLSDAAHAAARAEATPAQNADRHRTVCATLLARIAPRTDDPRWSERDLALFLAHRAASTRRDG